MVGMAQLAMRYRSTADFVERLRLAEQLITAVGPQLGLFTMRHAGTNVAEDILQETLRAIIAALDGFSGTSDAELWGWSYGIARRKIADHFRGAQHNRMTVLPSSEITELIEASEDVMPLATGELADLEYALGLLDAAKPECRDLLWSHYVLDMDYADIAEAKELKYDAVRMRVGRCLEEARALMA